MRGQDIDELALTFIPPLASKHAGDLVEATDLAQLLRPLRRRSNGADNDAASAWGGRPDDGRLDFGGVEGEGVGAEDGGIEAQGESVHGGDEERERGARVFG